MTPASPVAVRPLLDPGRVRRGVPAADPADGLWDLGALPRGGVAGRSRRHYATHPFDHAPDEADPAGFERRLSPLARRLGEALPRDGVVLEAGSGPGHMTAWLASRGVPVLALDQSLESLRRLRARTDAPGVRADVSALPFRSGAFRAVLADGVVHHAERPALAVRELVRVLAPGGLLFLRVYRAEGGYPTVYRLAGGVLRACDATPPLRAGVWRLALPAYRRAADARDRRRGLEPGLHDAGVFADYFLTPRATPSRGGTLLAALRRLGLEVLAYESFRNVHGFLARRRGARA